MTNDEGMTKSKRQGLFVIPSGVEESLDPVIDKCLHFARHDSEYSLLHLAFVLRSTFDIRHSSF
jgi:hypothetical protein